MTTLRYRVTKGPWVSELDARFGGPPENFMPNYEDALRRLGASQGSGTGDGAASLEELARQRVGDAAAAHFADDWLGNWWPEAQPIEPVLRAGLVEALKRGLATRLPLCALWVQATDGAFEIGISQSDKQITLLFLTPPAPSEPGGPPDEPGDVTIVSRRNGEVVVEPSAG